MNAKSMIAAIAATCALGAIADADVPETVATPAPVDGQAVAEANADDEDEFPVSVEFGVAFDSKYMTYGVVDGFDPIITPSATITFFDWVYAGVEAIFDVTKGNGRRGGYGNRAGKYTTLDAIVGVAHEFELKDDGLTLGVDVNYIYEYLPRYHGEVGDTQYVNLELSLGGLWIEPTLSIERDIMADEGTYVNLELAHTFTLVGEEDDPVLTFTPSVAQGGGNSLRAKGYFEKPHGGLMDTTIKGEFEWTLCENLALSAYVAYYDYWFDSNMRDLARDYNGAWGKSEDKSWNVVAGIALTASF